MIVASSAGTLRPIDNHLLSSLSREERERLWGHLEPVSLALEQPVYGMGGSREHVYFPITCVISFRYGMEDGSTAEMGMVGNNGMIGIASFLGGGTMQHRAVVQIAGLAFKMNARLLQAEFARGGLLQRALLLYTQSFLTQVSQTAVCNRLHSVEKRLCRWLLSIHDLVDVDELLITQEAIARNLGARRESVTVAAGRLQDAALIHCSRGHIRILDRLRLEHAACECYRVVRNEFGRLLDRSQSYLPKPVSCVAVGLVSQRCTQP
jgi:CRP-like cAMP-binding protein